MRRWPLLFSLALLSCAPNPRPETMDQIAAVRGSAQAKQAQLLAPQAYRHAEELSRRAERAHGDGDRVAAQILSEHAIAAYSHAFVEARLVKANERLASAKASLAKAQQELGALDEQERKLAAEAEDLEMRVRVARDALPLATNTPASAEREAARLAAARSLTSQARLLCTATRLLNASASGLSAADAQLKEIEKALDAKPKATPIDDAMKARAACLKTLTLVRRAETKRSPTAGNQDALLAELSRTGKFHPFRDDRGVVVTLREGKGATLSSELLEALSVLGRVAKAHPDFPVLVVVHGGASAGADKRLELLRDALEKAGASKVETASAGSAQPVIDSSRPDAASRNARIEIVFVAPAN